MGGSGGGHGRPEAVVDGHPALFEELLLEGADGQRVHDGHDEKGQVEGNDRGRDDEGRGLWAASFVEEVVLVRGVEHGEDEERSGDAERDDPDDRDLQDRVLLLLRVTVLEWKGQGHVPVDRYHAQVADGGRSEEDVQAVPGHAHQLRHRKVVWKQEHKQVFYLV